MKCRNKIFIYLCLVITFIIPINVFAYSDFIIVGGETIGIEVNGDGVLVVGFYKVNNDYIGKDAGFLLGDSIIKVNDVDVNNINEMVDTINRFNGENIDFVIRRDNKEDVISLTPLIDESGILKTGLYVKDKINGIGTLTYIDPGTNVFGALGHEIIESSTASKFEIKDGVIYNAVVDDITKSRNGSAGEKNATYNKDSVHGEINNNDTTGIYGNYLFDYSDRESFEVAENDEVLVGDAYIKTVISGEVVEDFSINILSVDHESETKNILFEIVDSKLLDATGGVVQGMSGSPIIQNGKIIGAVNYVLVNETNKGYGIFITTMLKEGESE